MKQVWHFKEFDKLTPKELYGILGLREEVFIVEQECIYNDLDEKDYKCSHLWCSLNNRVVAVCRIIPPGVSYSEASIGRIATHPDFRHLKLGHRIVEYSLQIIENLYKTQTVRIGAQVYLNDFYEKHGFVRASENYLEDNIPHMEMLRS